MRIHRRVADIVDLHRRLQSWSAALRPPTVSSSAAAKEAIAEYDRNGDGDLSKDEWTSSAELSAVAARYDANNNGVIDAGEIRAGVEEWQQNAVGPRQVPFTVSLDDRPLTGAMVRLMPAKFFGSRVERCLRRIGPRWWRASGDGF